MLGSEGARRAAPTTFNSLIYTHAGEITPQMVAWLSSIRQKDLSDCGKFVLTGDMSQLSINKVDLSNMSTLEGACLHMITYILGAHKHVYPENRFYFQF